MTTNPKKKTISKNSKIDKKLFKKKNHDFLKEKRRILRKKIIQ